jgi:uncharacterized protein YkwD
MTPPSTLKRSKTTAKVLALVLAMALSLSACFTTQQNQVANYVNNSRGARGIRPVAQNYQLTVKAQRWAEYLARTGPLAHSRLPSGITYRWRSLGENVGLGSSIRQVHRGYMNSSGHRANILSSRFNYIGTGYATGRGRVYTVQVFMQL